MKRAVVLVITDSMDRVLLLQRSTGHDIFPGQWCLPGGKVDYVTRDFKTPSGPRIFEEWEVDDEACVREAIEELGYVPTLIQDTGIIATGDDKRFIVKVFKLLNKLPAHLTKELITREFPNREHQSYGFFELNNLPEDIGKLTKQIVQQVLRR